MVTITGNSLNIGVMYFHSGSGGGDPGGNSHPHAAPLPPKKSWWQRFIDWIKSLL